MAPDGISQLPLRWRGDVWRELTSGRRTLLLECRGEEEFTLREKEIVILKPRRCGSQR